MSFDLCSTRIAERPYYIASIGTKIYTIEELCWFLHHNLCLIDQSIACGELVDWVRDELGLKSLARKLSDALERPDHDVSYFVLPIFQEIGYLLPGESRRVREELTRVQVQPEEQRTKTQADYLVKGGRLQAAMVLYRRILDHRSAGKLGAPFYASVWNNLGCALARQFCFKEAADAFLNGWQTSPSRELMRKYVSALPLFLTEEEYRVKMEEFGADGVLTGKIQEYNAACARRAEEKAAAYNDQAGGFAAVLEELKEEYRRSAFG
jgi:hypothetical protein